MAERRFNLIEDPFERVVEVNEQRRKNAEMSLEGSAGPGAEELQQALTTLSGQTQEAVEGTPYPTQGGTLSRMTSGAKGYAGQRMATGRQTFQRGLQQAGDQSLSPWENMKGVWAMVTGGFDAISPFSHMAEAAIASGFEHVAKATGAEEDDAVRARLEHARRYAPGDVPGLERKMAMPKEQRYQEAKNLVGTSAGVAAGLYGAKGYVDAARGGMNVVRSMRGAGGVVTPARMKAATEGVVERLGESMSAEQKALVTDYLTSMGHDEKKFSSATKGLETALKALGGDGDPKEGARVIADVLRKVKEAGNEMPPAVAGLDNSKDVVGLGTELRFELGLPGPYRSGMPGAEEVSSAKVAALTKAQDPNPVQYGEFHRRLDLVADFMHSRGLDIEGSPSTYPPYHPMAEIGPSGKSYENITDAVVKHFGDAAAPGDPDTGWALARQVIGHDEPDVLRGFDDHVLLNQQRQHVMREAEMPGAREIVESSSYAGQNLGSTITGPRENMLVTRRGGEDRARLHYAAKGEGFFVHKAESNETGRGHVRALYQRAYEMHGPYQGSTDLTAEGRGMRERLMRTDPHIFGHRAGEVQPHVLNEIAETVAREGGATVDPRTGQMIAREDGYSVSVFPEREVRVPEEEFSYRDIQKFTRENQDALAHPEAQLGMWKQDGKVYLDISKTVDKLEDAIAEGKRYGQRGVFSWKDKDTVFIPSAKAHGFGGATEPLSERAVKAAREYEQASTNPASRPAWQALARETDRLYEELVANGLTVERVTGQPYASADEMIADIRANNHIKVSTDNSDHPFWDLEQNTRFRVVHDMLGHVEAGHGFDLVGEERAFLRHAERLGAAEVDARKALQTEVYGQAASAVAKGNFQEQKAYLSKNGFDLPPAAERFSKQAERSISERLSKSIGYGWQEIVRRLNAPDLPGASRQLSMGVTRLPGERARFPQQKYLESVVEAARKGMNGAFWYRGAKDELISQFGDEWEKFADLLALLSPAKAVATDIEDAYKVWRGWKRGEPWEQTREYIAGTAKGMQGDQMKRLLYGGEDISTVLKSRDKVWNFALNIKGDEQAFTIDRWMWRAFFPEEAKAHRARWEARNKGSDSEFGYPGFSGTSGQYRRLERWARETAPKLIGPDGQPMTPATLQAAIWVGTRIDAGEMKANEPLSEMLKAYRMTDAEEFFEGLALSAKAKKNVARALVLGLMALPAIYREQQG